MLDHRLGLCRDLRISLSSQKHAEEAAKNEKPSCRNRNQSRTNTARQWLAFIDLHGLDQRHAMLALRGRLNLLESGAMSTGGTPLPPNKNSWLPKRLTVVTGRGVNSQPQGVSMLRNNVLNYLRNGGFDFVETPYIGCGCFEIRLGRKREKP